MATRPEPTIDLTDAEKRGLIALIQAGKALPEKHRGRQVRGWANKLNLSSLKSGPLRDIFENEWQSCRTRQDRALELKSESHVYAQPGRYQVALKVIDIFGNDTMTLVPVNVGRCS